MGEGRRGPRSAVPAPATRDDEGGGGRRPANPFRLPRLHPGIGDEFLRPDVLVETEQVRRVVRLLERAQPFVLRVPIGGPHSILSLLAQEVHVDAARRRGREYELTAAGEELRPLIDRLGEWGQRWARARIGRDDLDAGLLMWGIHRRIDVGALPPDRVVVRFDFRGAPATMRCPRTWWLLLARSEVDRRVGHLLLRPSTYISGLERGKQNPTIGALIRLATALEAGLDHVVVPGAAAPRP